MPLIALIVLPVLAGFLALVIRTRSAQSAILVGTAMLHAGAVGWLWAVPHGAPAPDDYLGLDPAGLLFLSLMSVLFLAVSIYTVGSLRDGTHDTPAAPHLFVPCLLAFLATMTLVTLSQHLPLMWAGVEATTLASAPLISFYRRAPALEATWKYLMLCSVGIALALLGTFFLGIAATGANGEAPRLTVTALAADGARLNRLWLQAAFVLALVGYGTKVGLAPLHTWLPDAHSQAPSQVSALLSGALLNCALLGIFRFLVVCSAGGEGPFAHGLLLFMGFLSIAVAAAFIVGQRDYKRLYAYSSVENMGIVAAGVGLGGAATYGAMLHAVNHSLCKAGLFMLAGNVLRRFGTTSAHHVRGLLRSLPLSGALLVLASLAIGGTPPFGPFVSELSIFVAAMNGPHPALGVLFVVFLGVAFLGTAGVILPMAQGTGTSTESGGFLATPVGPAREGPLTLLPPLVLMVAVLVLGLGVPGPLHKLLGAAAQQLGQVVQP